MFIDHFIIALETTAFVMMLVAILRAFVLFVLPTFFMNEWVARQLFRDFPLPTKWQGILIVTLVCSLLVATGYYYERPPLVLYTYAWWGVVFIGYTYGLTYMGSCRLSKLWCRANPALKHLAKYKFLF